MKKKIIKKIIIKKIYTKFSEKGKKNIEISKNFLLNLLVNVRESPKKVRKKVLKKLVKSGLILNFRKLVFKEIYFKKKLKDLNQKFDIFGNIFKRYKYIGFVAKQYYKLTDFHLELCRRLVRQKCGKKVFVNLKVQKYYNVLKRPNQMRMGGGKGSKFDKRISFLYPGKIFLEVRGVRYRRIRYVYKYLSKKMSFDFDLISFDKI